MKIYLKRKDIQKEVLLVSILLLGGIVLHFSIGNFEKVLATYPDELRYYTIARIIYMGYGLSMRGAAATFQKIAYSFVLVPFFAIEDGVLRIQMMNLANSIIIVSSVIPVWLICKELDLKRRTKVIVSVFVILWPETLCSMTFMAETLYWPLFFVFVYMWIYSERKRTYLNAVLTAVVCYIGYMTKEIFLAHFISYVLFQIMWVVYQCWTSRGDSREANIPRERIMSALLFMGVFLSIHLILKLTVFQGLGNSYNQMGIEAILVPYNFIYMFYAFFYYIAAILIVMLIVPFAYLFSHVEFLPESGKKLFAFALTFLLTASATIAYTISVREDLGRIAPRIHFRYLAPEFIIILAVFLCAMESSDKSKEKGARRKFMLIAFGMTVYACFIFKGTAAGSPVDQFSLGLYNTIVEHFDELIPSISGGKIFYTGVMVANIVTILFVILFHFLGIKHIKFSYSIHIAAVFLICLIGDLYGVKKIKSAMAADAQTADEVVSVNDYFDSTNDDIDIAYFTDADRISVASKYMDTYMDRIEGIYYVDDTFFEEVGKEYLIKDITLKESIWNTTYPKTDKIDYVIIENADFPLEITLLNCEKILGGGVYSVYKNNSPDRLGFGYNPEYYYTGEEMKIFFTGDEYNVNNFVVSGISGKEDGFSWTNADVMHVEIPSAINSGKVDVDVNVVGTFHGPRSYFVDGADGIASGQIDGPGTIHFTAEIIDHKISFDFRCNDARVVNTVYTESSDTRKVAFQIESIRISDTPN